MKYISARQFHLVLQDAYSAAHYHHHGGRADATCLGCAAAAEGSFLRAVASWEGLVVDIILQLMQGYGTRIRSLTRSYIRNSYGSRAAAESALLRTQYKSGQPVHLKKRPSRYILLHAPMMIADVADYWLDATPLSTFCRTNSNRIEEVLTIRHGIAHGTEDALTNLRNVVLTREPLKGYARPGYFLLDRPAVGAPTWLEFYLGELHDWAYISAPY